MQWVEPLILGALALTLAACGGAPEAETDTETNVLTPVEVPLAAPPEQAAPTPFTPAVQTKIDRLLKITSNGQITPIIREAEGEESFQSNFGGQPVSQHWLLLRRIGVDPPTKLREVLAQPYATKQVGDEVWYIWPDFAALPAADLIPEKLSFQDRARLRVLIGETGIAKIEAGETYPGVRTAIADNGRWVYFIHNVDNPEEQDPAREQDE